MLRPEDIQSRLREKPFHPFRIVAGEGRQFEIRHPGLVLVGRHDESIGFTNEEGSTIYDRVTRVALVHVVALEDLTSAPATDAGA